LSNLSPYLHFGQISSLEIALKILEASSYKPELQNDADALIEELVVRKELSDNWCYYNLDYDQLKGAPSWAQKPLLSMLTTHGGTFIASKISGMPKPMILLGMRVRYSYEKQAKCMAI
jgi:hypothetical protein